MGALLLLGLALPRETEAVSHAEEQTSRAWPGLPGLAGAWMAESGAVRQELGARSPVAPGRGEQSGKPVGQLEPLHRSLTYFHGPFLFQEQLKIHKLRKLTDGACGIFVSYLNL